MDFGEFRNVLDIRVSICYNLAVTRFPPAAGARTEVAGIIDFIYLFSALIYKEGRRENQSTNCACGAHSCLGRHVDCFGHINAGGQHEHG